MSVLYRSYYTPVPWSVGVGGRVIVLPQSRLTLIGVPTASVDWVVVVVAVVATYGTKGRPCLGIPHSTPYRSLWSDSTLGSTEMALQLLRDVAPSPSLSAPPANVAGES